MLRRQKINSDTKTMGYEKMNELTAKLRDLQAKNDDLNIDVKSYHRINNQQNKELETIDAVKNYPGKMQSVMHELRVVNKANRDLASQLAELHKTKKALRA